MPTLDVPTDPIMRLLRHDPAAAWDAWNAGKVDVTGAIWEDRDPHVAEVSYHGQANRG
jgi:hypothetical protein